MVNKINNIKLLSEGDKLNEILDNHKCYVLYFTASWCGPCKLISPHFESLSNNYNIEFIKIDIDECEEITSQFSIVSVPTFIFLKTQKEFYSKCEGSNIKLLLDTLTSLDKLSTKTEPIETEPIETEPIETEPIETEPIEKQTVYYNNIDSLENYDTVDGGDLVINSFLEAKNLETICTDINIEKEDDLNNFFNTPMNYNEINNIEEFYKLNISDIGDLNE